MQDTKLVRTSIDGDPHALVLRRTTDETSSPALLSADEETDVLAVTYEGSERFLEAWQGRIRRPGNVGVVGVGEQMRSAAATPAPEYTFLRGVADPTDVGTIRDVATWYLDGWSSESPTVVYFDSVTALLECLDADDAAEALGQFHRVLDAYDATGYFYLTPAAHDPKTVSAVASQFDTILECVETSPTAGSEPSAGDCIEAIADSRRRAVLAALADSETVSVADVAATVASRGFANRRQVHASLVGVHLPKLTEFGLLAYEDGHERVARGEYFGRVEPYLRTVDDGE